MTKLYDENKTEIDPIKLRKIQHKVYAVEREFYRTKNSTRQEMIEKIKRIIMQEHNKI